MAKFDTLFISCDYLKKNSPISSNVDDDILKPIIMLAQSKYVLFNVGSTLYDRICLEIQNQTLSGDYKILVEDYIQPTIVHYALYEGIEQIASQINNVGVVNKSSENSEPADESRIIWLEEKARQNGEFFSERMLRYLRANLSLFPEFANPGVGCDTIAPVITQYFSGISIPPR